MAKDVAKNRSSYSYAANWGEMTVSENVRLLARDGLSVSEIAQRLGIRYQHAYNVLRQSGQIKRSDAREPKAKPALSVAHIVDSGFTLAARWRLSDDGQAFIDGQLPKLSAFTHLQNKNSFYTSALRPSESRSACIFTRIRGSVNGQTNA